MPAIPDTRHPTCPMTCPPITPLPADRPLPATSAMPAMTPGAAPTGIIMHRQPHKTGQPKPCTHHAGASMPERLASLLLLGAICLAAPAQAAVTLGTAEAAHTSGAMVTHQPLPGITPTRTPASASATIVLAASDGAGKPAASNAKATRATPETPSTDAQPAGGNGRFVLGEELPKATPDRSGTAARDGQTGQDGATDYRPMDWDTLIPSNWEPLEDFKSLDFSSMSDSDPRAIAALRKLQKAWKNAPLNPTIQDEKIEISGFIVPLDSSDSSTIEEFLLVPYFGACIHVPPPPSNQVIHVTLDKPLKGFQMMDPVTVTGQLRPSRVDTPFGSAGYQLGARDVQPYEEADEPAQDHP